MRFIKSSIIILSSLLLLFAACEGPTGPDGPQGEEGQEGPIGPAGEDGATIHAGNGEPDVNIGNDGDFYLDLDEGLLYGPKSEDGWGSPISLIGPEGPAGEDGNTIYSADGPPDPRAGSIGDFYLDTYAYELYGPKNESGWGSPVSLVGPAGEDGNANVTLYILDGHDFSDSATLQRYLDIVDSSEEVTQSQWTAYLVSNTGVTYLMPGLGLNGVSEYRSFHQYTTTNNGSLRLDIRLEDGPGEEYEAVHLFRVEASEVNDLSSGSMTLDLDDYDKIMEYGKKNSMETRYIMDR